MFSGGCHCGQVRFELRTDKRMILDCNCSICTKKGFLHLIVEAEEFRLLRGEHAVHEYRFGTGAAKHRFCGQCGIHSYYLPRSHPQGISVNARCLDDWANLRDLFEIQHFEGSAWEENIHSIR